MRKLLAVVAGAAVAVLAIMAFEFVTHIVNASARSGASVADMNAPAKLMVAASWFLGTLAGAVAAMRIGRWPPAAWIVGALVLAGGIANVATIPHPLWMQAAAVLLPVLAVLAALGIERRRGLVTA